MKIRADFVTNSSSYNSCIIRIDNPVLERLLKKYKQQNIFRPTIEEYVCKDGIAYSDDRIETADVYLVPDSISDVAEDLLSVLCGHNFSFSPDEKLVPLQQDIIACKEEILSAYQSVTWKVSSSNYGEFGYGRGKKNFHWEKDSMHTSPDLDMSGIVFADKIFVFTGLSEADEIAATQIITAKKGIIKSSVVLKTDYLIVNPSYGYNTKKYLRAKELMQKGRHILIFSIDDFMKMYWEK